MPCFEVGDETLAKHMISDPPKSYKNIQKQGILHDPAGLLDVETGAVQVLFVTERAEDFQLALLTPKVWRVLSHRGTAISVGGLALWQSDSYPQLRARQ